MTIALSGVCVNLHLGHAEDRAEYIGLYGRSCNRADG